MCLIFLAGALVFISGEFVLNYTIFRYIKNYFKDDDVLVSNKSTKRFMFMEIQTFKGVLERFVLFVALYCSYTPMLVVFGALKLGTRLDNKNHVSNDYFLIGNFISILVAIFYVALHGRILSAKFF